MEKKLVNYEFLIDEYHESNANRYILLEKLGEVNIIQSSHIKLIL